MNFYRKLRNIHRNAQREASKKDAEPFTYNKLVRSELALLGFELLYFWSFCEIIKRPQFKKHRPGAIARIGRAALKRNDLVVLETVLQSDEPHKVVFLNRRNAEAAMVTIEESLKKALKMGATREELRRLLTNLQNFYIDTE